MEAFAFAASLAVIFAFLGFGMWLRQQRRVMIHRERLAALEKGIEPVQPIEQEASRITFNIQRLLLLAGLIWISVGIGFYMVFAAIVANPNPLSSQGVPYGIQYAGFGMIGVGVSHLIAYAAGRNKER
jgi:hypothetical protein